MQIREVAIVGILVLSAVCLGSIISLIVGLSL